MEEQYSPKKLEALSQRYWVDNKCFEVDKDDDKENDVADEDHLALQHHQGFPSVGNQRHTS